MTTRNLTPKQALFVSEILVDGNASAAAKRAGYSAKTADEQGHRLSRNAQVAAEIAKRQGKRLERNEVSAERVVAQLAATAFHDPLSAFDASGKLLPLDEIDPATRSAMMIEITEGFDGEGNPVQTRKTKFMDRNVALDKLARNLGMFNDKLKLSGDANDPILVMIQRINGQSSSIRPVIEGVVEDHDLAA
jgi:phage terminase small subunit